MNCPGFKCSKSGKYIECAKVVHWVHDFDLLIDILMQDTEIMIITIEGPLLKSPPCKSLRMEIHMHGSPMLQGYGGESIVVLVRVEKYAGAPITEIYPVVEGAIINSRDLCSWLTQLMGNMDIETIIDIANNIIHELYGEWLNVPECKLRETSI